MARLSMHIASHVLILGVVALGAACTVSPTDAGVSEVPQALPVGGSSGGETGPIGCSSCVAASDSPQGGWKYCTTATGLERRVACTPPPAPPPAFPPPTCTTSGSGASCFRLCCTTNGANQKHCGVTRC